MIYNDKHYDTSFIFHLFNVYFMVLFQNGEFFCFFMFAPVQWIDKKIATFDWRLGDREKERHWMEPKIQSLLLPDDSQARI